MTAPRPAVGFALELRSAIAEAHAAIERTPLALALAAGAFAPRAYARLLVSLLPVHQALEARLPASRWLSAALPHGLVVRSAALAADIALLEAAGAAPAPVAGELAAWLREAGEGRLLGAGYVVAGSCLGSTWLRPRIATGLGRADGPGQGTDYHRFDDQALAGGWAGLRATLDALAEGRADVRAAVRDGAARTMQCFLRLYREIEPA